MGEIKPYKKCLLLTGTVVPNSNFVAHTNVEQRRMEYYDGILYYATEFPNEDLFFLENSTYDFGKDEQFQQLFSDKKITLMKFPVSDKFEKGKGYQEFAMLDEAVNQLSGKYNSFIKITGRYKVLNLKQITDVAPKSLVIDCHKKPGVAQTNVFCCTFDHYSKYISHLYKEVDDSKGIYIEKIVYEKIVTAGLINEIIPFPLNPLITGVSGSYGGTLARNKWKMKMRNVERSLMRLFGIKQFLIEY